MPGSFSKRVALRAGYGAVIAVLVLSAVEAYRIQASLSQQQLEIYRHYVEQDRALSVVRRSLWTAGNYVRDFFILTTPEHADQLRAQLGSLKADCDSALKDLEDAPTAKAMVPELRRRLEGFWNVVGPLPQTMLSASKNEQFDFLQREIVPRRGMLYKALLDVTAADQERLQDSEREFAATRRRATQRLMLMLSLSVVMAFLVARFSVRQAENLERRAEVHYAEVERARGELQQLSARLLEMEEESRRRLSRELHDELGQSLALLQIEMSHALNLLPGQPAAARERLARARDMAEKTVQNVRNISVLLRPALLDDLGLTPALQFQLEEFLRRNSIECEFVEEGVSDYLPDGVKTCVYRVVQEALHNCEKHAGATKVRVTVEQRPDCLIAEVQDNGRGFRLEETRKPSVRSGLGLLGMRERVSSAGGTLVIDSVPRRGTRIALRIPLPLPQGSDDILRSEVTA